MEQSLPKRSEVPVSMTWRLEDIYETVDKWEEDLEKANRLAEELAGLEGHIVESPSMLLKAMKLFQDTMETISSVYSYANMKHDQDTAEPEKPCSPATRVYCSLGASRLAATKEAGA